MLAYDTTNPSTFENLGYWLQEVKRHARTSCPVVLVGTKTDLKAHRAVSEEAVRAFAEQYCGGAKTNEGVDHAFQLLAEQIFRRTVTTGDNSEKPQELPRSVLDNTHTLESSYCTC
jgi:Ras-related protein Rab-11A